MNLQLSSDDVIRILRDTGALREGHFEFPNGSHSNEYLEAPLAMRHYQYARILSVALSRLLRANSEIRTVIPELSIVAPGMSGLPVAFGICEALQAKKVYWAERTAEPCAPANAYRFRPFIEPEPGEQVMLVDDILHSGANLAELKTTIESFGAIVIGLAVIIYRPAPRTHNFGSLPFYHLAKLDASYFADAGACDLCASGQPVTRVWI